MGIDGLDRISSGTSSTRVSVAVDDAERQRRADIDAAAVRYLTRTGNKDILPILGLDGAPAPQLLCANPACATAIIRAKPRTRYCSPGCSAKHQNEKRRGKRRRTTAT